MSKEYSSDSEDDGDYVPEEDIDEDNEDSCSNADSDDDDGSTKLNRKSNHKQMNKDDDKVEKNTMNEIDDDENEKKKSDDLWSAFLQDTPSTASAAAAASTTKTTTATSTTKTTKSTSPSPIAATATQLLINSKIENTNNQETETKISTEKPQITKPKQFIPNRNLIGTKRPISTVGAAGGLGAVLNHINKKTKLSTLEKSKLDWTGFKHSQGINEEIQTHNKGKSGFLERQDFLQRTDLRQFEIEKDLRTTKRLK